MLMSAILGYLNQGDKQANIDIRVSNLILVESDHYVEHANNKKVVFQTPALSRHFFTPKLPNSSSISAH